MANIQTLINNLLGSGSAKVTKANHKALVEKFVSHEEQTLTSGQKAQVRTNIQNEIIETIVRPARTDRNIIFEGNSRTADWHTRNLKEGITWLGSNMHPYADTVGVLTSYESYGRYSYPYYLMQQPNFNNRYNYYNVAMWGTSNLNSWWAGILTSAKYNADIYPLRPEANGGVAGIAESWIFIMTGILDCVNSNPTSIESHITAFRNYCSTAKSHGFKVVVLGEYFGYSPNYRVPNSNDTGVCNYVSAVNEGEKARQKYNNAMMESACKGDIEMYIDIDHLFTPNLDETKKDPYHSDTIFHLTDAAHRLIAEYINSLFSASGTYKSVAYNRFVDLTQGFNKVDKEANKSLASDTEKSTWNAKQNALGYTAENVTNKVTSISSSSTNTQYPTAKCLYDTIGDIETLLASL